MKFYTNVTKKLCTVTITAAALCCSFLPVSAQEDTTAAPTLAEKLVALKEQHDAARNTFEEVHENVEFVKNANAKDAPDSQGVVVETIEKGEKGILLGKNNYASWQVEVDGEVVYVNKHVITVEEAKEEPVKEEAKAQQEEAVQEETTVVNTYNTGWTGQRLTAQAGAIMGPTGRETYYNLPMDGVISIMRSMGNNDPYWVREDGVKMLGNYVIVAANLNVFPRGSLVECSLGTAIVCDTGGFAAANPYALDIATAW